MDMKEKSACVHELFEGHSGISLRRCCMQSSWSHSLCSHNAHSNGNVCVTERYNGISFCFFSLLSIKRCHRIINIDSHQKPFWEQITLSHGLGERNENTLMLNIVRGSYSFLDKTILLFFVQNFCIIASIYLIIWYYLYENGIQFGYRKNTLNPVTAS